MKPSGALQDTLQGIAIIGPLPIFLKYVYFLTLLLGAFPWQGNDLKRPHGTSASLAPFS